MQPTELHKGVRTGNLLLISSVRLIVYLTVPERVVGPQSLWPQLLAIYTEGHPVPQLSVLAIKARLSGSVSTPRIMLLFPCLSRSRLFSDFGAKPP